MFKKVFRSISNSLGPRKEEPKPGTWVSSRPKPVERARNLIDKISATLGTPAAANAAPVATTSAPTSAAKTMDGKSPEELCAILPQMAPEEIRIHLALLYRRYNRATSSLDAKIRAEAETMLDAIVAVREKTFGPI